MNVAACAGLVSSSLCATLSDTARPSSMRAKTLMAKRMSSMAGIAYERMIAERPESHSTRRGAGTKTCRTLPNPNRRSNNAQSRKMLPLQMLYFEDISIGMTEMLKKTIASSDVVGFPAVSGDRNPIHLSEHFAAKTPFGTRIAHGLYTASLISAVLGTRLPGPGAVYISQTLNFRAPVKIGDTVDVSVEVVERI